jgi:hypothetical protein
VIGSVKGVPRGAVDGRHGSKPRAEIVGELGRAHKSGPLGDRGRPMCHVKAETRRQKTPPQQSNAALRHRPHVSDKVHRLDENVGPQRRAPVVLRIALYHQLHGVIASRSRRQNLDKLLQSPHGPKIGAPTRKSGATQSAKREVKMCLPSPRPHVQIREIERRHPPCAGKRERETPHL